MFKKIEAQKILSRKERIILYITALILIASLIFNFSVIPVLQKNDSLNKEIYANRRKLNKYLSLLNQKENIRKEYNKFFGESGGNPLNPDDSAQGLSNLDGLAKKSNIRIVDMRSQAAPKKSASYKEIIIDLKTEGQMEGYLKFLYEMETSASLLKIKKFQLIAKSRGRLLEGSFSISQAVP